MLLSSFLNLPASPGRLSLAFFPPQPPLASLGSMPTAQYGDQFERFVQYHLIKRFPLAFTRHKAKVMLAPGIYSECDIILYAPVAPPLRPEFYIIECKKYSGKLPLHFIADLSMRVLFSSARGGILCTTAHVSKRNRLFADFLGIRIWVYDASLNSFYSLSHESITPPLLSRSLCHSCIMAPHDCF